MKWSKDKVALLYFLSFTSSFFVVGFLFAFWYGMGWFLFFHSIRGILASMPKIYLPIIRALIGSESISELEAYLLSRSKGGWFVSRTAILLNIVNIILTILVFWKANIPIYKMIETLVR